VRELDLHVEGLVSAPRPVEAFGELSADLCASFGNVSSGGSYIRYDIENEMITLGGHDPEDWQHAVGDPPTNLVLLHRARSP